MVMFCGPGLARGMAQQQPAGSDLAIPGQVYMQVNNRDLVFTSGQTGIDALDARTAQYGVTAIEKAFPIVDAVASRRTLSPSAEALRYVYRVRYASPHRPSIVAQDLSAVAEVGYAEPVYRKVPIGRVGDALGFLDTPDDPLYAQQTHLPRLELPAAWDVVKGEEGSVVIAIVDGGTDWRHQDLEDNVWFNPNEIDGDGVDNDGNGYVDDIHGWNFTTNSPDPTGLLGGGEHGTAVAGVAAAVTDNSTDIAGSSWNALFMPLSASCSDWNLLCYTLEGIAYAAMNGAHIATASYGSSSSSVTGQMVYQAALDAGMLVVAASGNGGVDVDVEPHYPSSYSTTLSVGGTFKNNDQNVFNYGRTVNVFAPGVAIDVTLPGNATDQWSGTSFSAPLVAGVAALVKTEFPTWGPERVREQLRLTAVSIDGSNPQSLRGKYGRGRVDAHAAVTAAPQPALRVTGWSYQNQSGNQQIKSGDNVDVVASFTNYHGEGTGLEVSLQSLDNYITWTTQTASIGTLATGDSVEVTFKFQINANAPNNRTLRLYPRITDSAGFSDESDLFRMSVNETGVAAHSTPGLSVSITDEGNIGYTSYQGAPNSRGVGFNLTNASGTPQDVLFEGGLLIATSASRVSDCVRQQEADPNDQQRDFVIKSGTAMEVMQPGLRSSEQGRVTLDDSYALNPIGVEVLQESYVDDNPNYQDLLILQYTITNQNANEIDNMHVGLFFDWDVAPGASDVVGWDAQRGTGWVMDHASNPTAVTGVRLLTPHTLHYAAIDNAATIYRGQGNNGFTGSEKWNLLTGGVQNNGQVEGSQVAKDVSQLIAAGPFSIQPGNSVEVAFALISGSSESEFLTNADHAVTFWDHVSTAADNEVAPASAWQVHAPFPHPAVTPVTLRIETAAMSSVSLTVYDLLGRRIRTVLDDQRPAGIHAVTWDGRNELGGRVSPGMYIVRMTAKGGRQMHTHARPILVF